MRILVLILFLSFIGPSFVFADLAKPQLVKSVKDDFHIYINNGRYYVIGSEEALDIFLNNGHIPKSRTILGQGPLGETVVIEIDKNNPKQTEYLQKKFMDTEIAIIFY